MNNEEKKEVHDIYEKYAKQALIDCKDMTREEEKKYNKQKEKELEEELNKVKGKYNTQK